MFYSNNSSLLVGILLLASVLTHFVWLDWPAEVVFDEVHFGKFITAYCCTGERIFDIHPPHAKLLIAAAAVAGGYRGNFSFERIGQPYGEVPVVALRIVPALAGMMLPLIIFGLLRQLGTSPLTAFMGGALAVFDNALTVQTRLMLLDGVLLAATFGSLRAFLAAEARGGWRRIAFFALAGGLASLAVGVKFTGLAALGLLGIIVMVRLLRERTWLEVKRRLIEAAVIVISAAVVYAAGWVVHFAVLTVPGPGDVWQVPSGNMISDTIALHRTMLSANYGLDATHPDSSSWWSWPWMKTSVFYWQGEGAALYFLGNPVVWWGGSVLFIAAAIALVAGRRQIMSAPIWIPVAGYLIAMLPLVGVPRALFLYHYLTPLLFSLLVGLMWLDTRIRSQELQRRVYGVALIVLLAGFIFFSPLTYGFEVPPEWFQAMFWLPDWR